MVTTPLRRNIRRRTRKLHSNTSTKSIPKWALPASPYCAPQDDYSPLSLTSSLTSTSLRMVATVSKVSKTSFKWTPEALVQSWHGKLRDNYEVLSIIGEGRSGAVFVVNHKRSGKSYACKFLKKSDHDAKTLKTEIQTLRRLDHPNIVRLYETHEDGDSLFLLMELCSGGDLLDNVSEAGCLGEATARVFAQQMLSALAYCHANGVAHRDVKPENFLLESDDSECLIVKLADFGIATSIRPEHLSSCSRPGDDRGAGQQAVDDMCGSLPYMAPETFTARRRKVDADSSGNMAQLCASDLWSCGVCIYAMMCGRLPFGESPERICSGDPPDFSGPSWETISEEAVDLIRKLLNPTWRERCTAQQALAHEWLRGGSTPLDQSTPEEGLRTPDGLAENLREFALVVLRSMRRWRKMPKLRRIAIAAMAKRLEANNDAKGVAESAYALFSGTSDALRCQQLVQVLHGALCESTSPLNVRELNRDLSAGVRFSLPSSASPTPASLSTASPASTDAGRLQGGSITGLHVRQRVRKALRRLTAGSPRSGFGLNASASGSATSMEELRHLVAALDGMKDGMVDYTLFVAALLPPDMNFSDQQISEVFSLFDTKKRGFISPGDLQAAVRSGDADLRHYTAMITEFDHNGDGVLDEVEFRAMVLGTSLGETVDGGSG